MPKAKKSDTSSSAKKKTEKEGKNAFKPKVEGKKKASSSTPIAVVESAPRKSIPPADVNMSKKTPVVVKTVEPAVAGIPPKVDLVISSDDIGLRAYFIAERRRAMGWPGDETSDWVEAERQLREELTKKGRIRR